SKISTTKSIVKHPILFFQQPPWRHISSYGRLGNFQHGRITPPKCYGVSLCGQEHCKMICQVYTFCCSKKIWRYFFYSINKIFCSFIFGFIAFVLLQNFFSQQCIGSPANREIREAVSQTNN